MWKNDNEMNAAAAMATEPRSASARPPMRMSASTTTAMKGLEAEEKRRDEGRLLEGGVESAQY